tara:strand:- start:636 stop:2162 length:1527 start_codon:yes stop_codon:yes gene_type:complete
MFSYFLKNLSILKKFLFINLLIFIIIMAFAVFYLRSIQPTLIIAKTKNHIEIIENTIDHIRRLNINFEERDVKNFLISTRFLFQDLSRVIIFDNNFELIGDTNTLDLDPRSFSKRIEIVEMSIGSLEGSTEKEITSDKENLLLKSKILNYSNSTQYGKTYTYTEESYNQFSMITLKNVTKGKNNIGYLAIVEKANDVKAAINERKVFVIRTAMVVAIVIFIFSFVLNRYFLKPIKNLVNFTKNIKDKNNNKVSIDFLKLRNDELGILSKSLDEMTKNLNNRITTAKNFSSDLVHEIRNPLASLKSASEIIGDTDSKKDREKLIKIVSHDVERIERLITDYSQMLKDEAAISSEKMNIIDLKEITKSVVDDFNSIYNTKKNISIKLVSNGHKKYKIYGIENRLEQIIANLLDNSISFSQNNKNIFVELKEFPKDKINLTVIDEGEGFKERDTSKIFKRFYSNRPNKFGEHSGLGLNIVKNLVELHNGVISATNNNDKSGAKVEIIFPKA